MTKVDAIKKYMSEGTILLPLQWHKDREKAYGAMYAARLVVKYANIELYFDMWYHHSSEVAMTEEEVLANIRLSGIKYNGNSYDLYWHSKRFGGRFYLHEVGWFGFSKEARALENNPLLRDRDSSALTTEEEQELFSLGFIRIPELDW